MCCSHIFVLVAICILIPITQASAQIQTLYAAAYCNEEYQCIEAGHGQASYCDARTVKCACRPGYVFDDGFKCVPHGTSHEPDPESPQRACGADEQCQAYYGQLTICNTGKVCECFDTISSGKNKVVFYNQKCVIAKMNGQLCTKDQECQAGHHRDSFCAPEDDDLNGPRTCKCRAGLNCDFHSGAGFKSMLMVTISTIFLGLVATKVIT